MSICGFQVEVIKEHNGVYEGSVIYVEKETKTLYKGIWPFMGYTSTVNLKKKYCKKIKK